MKLVIQRVKRASVSIAGQMKAEIGPGLLVLVGVGRDDTHADAAWLANKTAQLRIFDDGAGKMNKSVADVGGAVLVVSQFTLYGDCVKGNRPSFIAAAPPEEANDLYEEYVRCLAGTGLPIATGCFREMMVVGLENDGPVTLLLESHGRSHDLN